METDRLVDDYLRRLEHAAAHLRPAHRTELIAEIRGHIEAALDEEQAAGEAAVRNVLDRLGSPDEIVEASEPSPARRRVGALEIVTLIALVIPIMGWLVGLILACVSRVWSRRDKVIAAFLLLVPIAIVTLGFVTTGSGIAESAPTAEVRPIGEGGPDPGGLGPVELILFVAGVPSAVYLGWRLHRGRGTA